MNHCVSSLPWLEPFFVVSGTLLTFAAVVWAYHASHTHTHTLSFTAISRREQLAEESVDLMTLTETIARLGKNLDLM